MITRNLTLTITDKSVSLDKAIILYQYDRGVTFNFKLVSADYTFNEAEITKARAIIKRPNKDISVSEIDAILDGIYTFHLDGSYTNDTFEIGTYTMQLQLYSDSDECITIAPFNFEVKNLIGLPPDDTAYVGYSTVGNSSARGSEVLDTGDLENGEYLETVWVDKDIISTGRLNKIETVLDYLVEDAANNSANGPITDLEAVNSISMGRTGEVGANSVALGTNCQAGNDTSAIGYGLIANASVTKKGQCVVGRYNEEDPNALFIVGNGIANVKRNNAIVVNTSGVNINDDLRVVGTMDAESLSTEKILMGQISDDGSTKQIIIDNTGILIKSEVKYNEDGQILSPEEDYVPTKEYVDNAIANIDSDLDIMVIGDGSEEYIFTGNEFTEEEYDNGVKRTVYINGKVSIKYLEEETGKNRTLNLTNELVHMSILNKSDYKQITIKIQGGNYRFLITSDGTITMDLSQKFVKYSALDNYATISYVDEKVEAHALEVKNAGYVMDYQLNDYATKEELQTALGDIESLLEKI